MKAQDYLWETSRELARDSFGKYIKNPCRRLYLYGQKNRDGVLTKFEIVEDSESDIVLAESIPRNMTIEALQSWFIDRLKSSPIIPREMAQ